MAGIATLQMVNEMEIIATQMTDTGLAHLSSCKMLDSIQIQSSVPISRQATARLKTELPNMQTLDICQSESRKGPRPLAARQP